MSSRPPQAPGAWLPYAGLLLTVAAIVYQGGVESSKIDQNTSRIAALEARQGLSDNAVNSTNVRLARIEAKLDFIVPKGAFDRSVNDDGTPKVQQ